MAKPKEIKRMQAMPTGMPADQIQELMELNGWSTTDLAAKMKLSEGAILNWLRSGGAPLGPATVLMGIWLEEARAKGKRGKQLATA